VFAVIYLWLFRRRLSKHLRDLSCFVVHFRCECVRFRCQSKLIFVSETRKNFHSFSSYDELVKVMLYNYCPVFTNSYFEQEYIFGAESTMHWWTLGRIVGFCVLLVFVVLVIAFFVWRRNRKSTVWMAV